MQTKIVPADELDPKDLRASNYIHPTPEAFAALTRDSMTYELWRLSPEAAKGKTRARKDELIELYSKAYAERKAEELKMSVGHATLDTETGAISREINYDGVKTGRLRSDVPNECSKPGIDISAQVQDRDLEKLTEKYEVKAKAAHLKVMEELDEREVEERLERYTVGVDHGSGADRTVVTAMLDGKVVDGRLPAFAFRVPAFAFRACDGFIERIDTSTGEVVGTYNLTKEVLSTLGSLRRCPPINRSLKRKRAKLVERLRRQAPKQIPLQVLEQAAT